MAFESRRKALLASTERRPSTSHVSLWRAEQSMKSPDVILVVNHRAWDRNGLNHSFTASIFRTELVARSELSFRILASQSALTTRVEHATVLTIPRRAREPETFMSMQASSSNQDYVNSHTGVASLELYSMVSCNRRVVPERSQHLIVTNFKLRTSRRSGFNRYNFRRPRGSIATCRPQWVHSLHFGTRDTILCSVF